MKYKNFPLRTVIIKIILIRYIINQLKINTDSYAKYRTKWHAITQKKCKCVQSILHDLSTKDGESHTV